MKRFLPILTLCFFSLVTVHILTFVLHIKNHQAQEEKQYRQTLIQEVMNIIHMIQATPTPELERAIKTLDTSRVTVSVTDKPLHSHQVTNLTYWYINHLVKDGKSILALSLLLPDNRWCNVKANIHKTLITWSQLISFLTEIGIGLFIFFYAWSINRYTRPLKEFQRAAEKLGVSFNTTKLEEFKGPKIVRETSEALNTMQRRIQELINDRTLMLAAISHDLRTPLTRLKLRANFFKDNELKQKTIHDLDIMEAMIKDILRFSKNENEDEEKRKLDLNSFIQTICDELSDLGFSITYHTTKSRSPCFVKKNKLRRGLINIIENAVKYGKHATISMTKQDSSYAIVVKDEGPGIDKKEIENVFRPFYRLDQSRNRNIAGTGLGLSIAQSAVIAHGGTITLNNMHSGLKVTIVLPVE